VISGTGALTGTDLRIGAGAAIMKQLALLRGYDMQVQLTAVFKKVPQGYIGFVEELPGANTQGATLEEARTNLMEAIQMVLEANRTLAQESLEGQDVIREPMTITAA
jgi:predicted RNase H-like HicB family nuclease